MATHPPHLQLMRCTVDKVRDKSVNWAKLEHYGITPEYTFSIFIDLPPLTPFVTDRYCLVAFRCLPSHRAVGVLPGLQQHSDPWDKVQDHKAVHACTDRRQHFQCLAKDAEQPWYPCYEQVCTRGEHECALELQDMTV